MHMRTRTQPPPPDPLIGKTILSFRIEEKLAEGGMGAVYLARHEELTNTLKVIKLLLPGYAKDPVIRQRFRREAEAASLLKHDKILSVDNFGTLEDGQLFMMVPFLEGEPLDAYLHKRGGRLAPHRALHLVVQICDALDYAHARGVIHRDLKPGNVFMVSTSSYQPKLLDFGIAKLTGAPALGPRTQSGAAIGTPGYMAVEQYEHADEVTPAADVYSLAVMIWEIVTGRRPWDHPDHAVIYFLQRTVDPERPPIDVMPADWTEALLRALSVDPGARPSARELAVALASALPAVGRVPSGAEILTALAPHFVRKAAPDDDTVRNASHVDRIGPLLWPPRETEPGGLEEAAHTSAQAAVDTRAPAVQAQPIRPTGDDPPPAALRAMQTTTLSAATGVTSLMTGRPGRWKLALAAIGTAGLATLATGALATHAMTDTPSSLISKPGGAGEPSQGAKSNAVRQAPQAAPATPSQAVATPSVTPATTSARPSAIQEPARRVSAAAREPTSAAHIATLKPVRASQPELGSPHTRTMSTRGRGHGADQASRPRESAPAPHAPAQARAAAKDGPTAKPVEPLRTDTRRPRRPLLANPDDVVGPEM